ncbi:MAG: GNAT family N-acetyltransferase, partial [Acidimicrobiales bacterium]
MRPLDRDPSGWVARVETLSPDVVREIHEAVAARGGGHLTVWVSPAPSTRDPADRRGDLTFGRDLLQLRRPLPMDGPRTDLIVRAFVPGRDEDPWLDLNNRAFAGHPEQGGWTRAELDAREAEPWFDPAGFLLHERDGNLVAFCWTK